MKLIDITNQTFGKLTGVTATRKIKLQLHHIMPIHVDSIKYDDRDNLIRLCKTCHNQIAHPSGPKSLDLTIAEFLSMRVKENMSNENSKLTSTTGGK